MKEKEIICPFCDEGALKNKKCTSCHKNYLICDECESVYIDYDSLDKEFQSKCPHCGADIS
jgi:hypothetical protein